MAGRTVMTKARDRLGKAFNARVVLAMALVLCGCATHAPMSARERFAHRVEEYVEMRRQAVQQVGAITRANDATGLDATELDAKTTALASAIQKLRMGLERGVIFSGDVAAEIRDVLAKRMNAPDRDAVVRALQSVSPVGYQPQFNGTYPERQPVESTPPSLLATLPPLPPVLAYRFVGRDLLLVDRDTRVIVDILPQALPASAL